MVGLNTACSGMPPNWVRWMKAGQPTAIVDAAGRGDFRTVQAGVDAVEALVVAGLPGGCVWVRAGTYKENVTVAQANIVLQGESWDVLIDGEAAGQAIFATGNRCTIRDLSAQTTAGGGNSSGYAIWIGSGSQEQQVINCWVRESDDRGILDHGSEQLIQSCRIDQSDNIGITAAAPRSRYIDNYIFSSGGVGIQLGDTSDNTLIVGNHLEANTTNSITVHSLSEDCLVVGNVVDLAISDSSGTSTVANNEQY